MKYTKQYIAVIPRKGLGRSLPVLRADVQVVVYIVVSYITKNENFVYVLELIRRIKS